MTRAVCPGSFDPVTHGHLDVIERTARMVDHVVVAVGTNVSKNVLFTPKERVEMLIEECAQWGNVEVTLFRGLLVDFCAPTASMSSARACAAPISITSCRWRR
jgi:pantetheine-phosphate adenylyltransferase